jgi:hypothetical protein
MEKQEKGAQIPIGLGLALEQKEAMDYFCSLSVEEQNRIINQIHGMHTTQEIVDLVEEILPTKNKFLS